MGIYESVLLMVPILGISLVAAAAIAAGYAVYSCRGGKCSCC